MEQRHLKEAFSCPLKLCVLRLQASPAKKKNIRVIRVLFPKQVMLRGQVDHLE